MLFCVQASEVREEIEPCDEEQLELRKSVNSLPVSPTLGDREQRPASDKVATVYKCSPPTQITPFDP